MSYKGKAIYNPSGKAGEYSQWACNFYVGCSNGCEYCYCKKGILAVAMGQDEPQLKKCFRDEDHALKVFRKELQQNLDTIREHGIFFSFTTDPLLDLTMDLTVFAIEECIQLKVPVKILTKRVDNALFIFGGDHPNGEMLRKFEKYIALGFTLTGHDELEPVASTFTRRILHVSPTKATACIPL